VFENGSFFRVSALKNGFKLRAYTDILLIVIIIIGQLIFLKLFSKNITI